MHLLFALTNKHVLVDIVYYSSGLSNLGNTAVVLTILL